MLLGVHLFTFCDNFSRSVPHTACMNMSACLFLPQAGSIVTCPSPIHSWTHQYVPCSCLMRRRPCRASTPLAERLADRTCKSHCQARVVRQESQSFIFSSPYRSDSRPRCSTCDLHGASEYEAVAAAFNKPTVSVSSTERVAQAKHVSQNPSSLRACFPACCSCSPSSRTLRQRGLPQVPKTTHRLTRTAHISIFQCQIQDRVTNHWKDAAPTAQKRLVDRATMRDFRTPPLNLSGQCRCADHCDCSRKGPELTMATSMGHRICLCHFALRPEHSCSDRTI